jgi:hypothetical protein
LRSYAASWKVASSSLDYNIVFFLVHLSFLQRHDPGIYSEMNAIKYFWGKARRALKTDEVTVIYEALLSRKCGILNIARTSRPPLPVTGITLRFFYFILNEFTKIVENVNLHIQRTTNNGVIPSESCLEVKSNIPSLRKNILG